MVKMPTVDWRWMGVKFQPHIDDKIGVYALFTDLDLGSMFQIIST